MDSVNGNIEVEAIKDLTEDKRLLQSKIAVYKEEIQTLKSKLEYTGNLFALYESVLNCAKEESKELAAEIKKLKAKNSELELKISKSPKKTAKKATVKKSIKKDVKKPAKKTIKKATSKKSTKKTTKKN